MGTHSSGAHGRAGTLALASALAGCADAPPPEVVLESDYTLTLDVRTLANQAPFSAAVGFDLIIESPDGATTFLEADGTAGRFTFDALPRLDNGTRVHLVAVDAPSGGAWAPASAVAHGAALIAPALTDEGDGRSADLLVTSLGEPGLLHAAANQTDRLFGGVAVLPDGTSYLFGGMDEGAFRGGSRPAGSDVIWKLAPEDRGRSPFTRLDATMPELELLRGGSPFVSALRVGHTATVVDDDGSARVLVTGGRDVYNLIDANTDAAPLFDPTTDDWLRDAGGALVALTMPYTRSWHRAVPLVDGTVLFVGGLSSGRRVDEAILDHAAVIYNPDRRRFTALDLANQGIGVWQPAAASLGILGALVCGGADLPANPSADPWSPADGCVRVTLDGALLSAAPLPIPLFAPALTPLASGEVLLTGGMASPLAPTSAAFIEEASTRAFLYDPEADRWDEIGPLDAPRTGHEAVATVDGGAVLIGGVAGQGSIYADTLAAAACPTRFDPVSQAFSRLASACGDIASGAEPMVASWPGVGAIVLGGYQSVNGDFRGSRAVGWVATGPDL